MPREPFMPSTEKLVKALQAGDQAAFGQLVRLYERAVILTAHAALHDFHAAQDAAQEAFVIAYAKLDQLREAAAFGPWMLQIVRRQALLMQRKPRAEPMDSEIVAATRGPSGDWIKQYEEVVEQLARLPEHERTVVVLRYVDGHSVQKISDTIGKPVGTVTKQLSRAVQRLRTWLMEVPS
jgi:RNA polymerase sigma-70 factor (ECF subfamily)